VKFSPVPVSSHKPAPTEEFQTIAQPAAPLRALSDGQNREVERAMEGGDLRVTVGSPGNTFDLTDDDLWRVFAEGRWVNDNVINAYTWMVALSENCRRGYPAIVPMDSFFFATLKGKEASREVIVKRVKNAVRTSGADFDKVEMILIPAFLGGNHWALIVLHIKLLTVKFYDSRPLTPIQQIKKVSLITHAVQSPFLNSLTSHKDLEPLLASSEIWGGDKTDFQSINVPGQRETNECGIIVCEMMRFVVRGEAVSYSTNRHSIAALRKVITFELLRGRLLGDPEELSQTYAAPRNLATTSAAMNRRSPR
jgi:Ulp1 family protease